MDGRSDIDGVGEAAGLLFVLQFVVWIPPAKHRLSNDICVRKLDVFT